MSISAIVLTKNESANIRQCLKSLQWCDEILVVDDYSEDRTRAISRDSGAKVFKRKLNNNFAQQRNYGLSQAKGGWSLFIDADEIVSPELAEEIQEKIKDEEVDGYFLWRQDYWLGRKLKGGESGRTKLLRLARTRSGKWQRAVHEVWNVGGRKECLKNVLNHYPHPSLNSFLTQINFYSQIHAQENQKQGKKASLLKILFYPSLKFIRNYIFKNGFVDGTYGFVNAMIMSFHSFLAWSNQWLNKN